MTVAGISFGQVINVLGPNVGFPGTISRFTDRIVSAKVFTPTTSTNNLNFGDPAVLVANNTGGLFDSVADFVATVANIALLYKQFAGMAVREVKTQLQYENTLTPGTNQLGYYSNGQMAEVLERGSGVVTLSVGAPNANDQVYTRVVLNGAVTAGVLGDWETNPAASDLFQTATTLTEGSTAATAASGTNIAVGQLISGPGIAPGTYVAAVSGTSVTLSQNAIATFASTGSLLTYSNLFAIPGCVVRTGDLDTNNSLEITFLNRLAA